MGVIGAWTEDSKTQKTDPDLLDTTNMDDTPAGHYDTITVSPALFTAVIWVGARLMAGKTVRENLEDQGLVRAQ